MTVGQKTSRADRKQIPSYCARMAAGSGDSGEGGERTREDRARVQYSEFITRRNSVGFLHLIPDRLCVVPTARVPSFGGEKLLENDFACCHFIIVILPARGNTNTGADDKPS